MEDEETLKDFTLPGLVPAGPENAAATRLGNERPSWEEYFLDISHQVAQRSTCRRRNCGAVLVSDGRILATGYNGAPRGLVHCLDRGCLREELGIESGQRHELCRGLHAEQNALLQAAQHGVKIAGSEIYTTHQPCVQCAKMLINGGIKKIYYLEAYPDLLATEMLSEAGIESVRFEKGQ